MDIQKIGIVGAGQMGNGIAHVCALSGYDVVLNDISQESLDAALATIRKNLDRQVSREKFTQADEDAAMGRISTTSLALLMDALTGRVCHHACCATSTPTRTSSLAIRANCARATLTQVKRAPPMSTNAINASRAPLENRGTVKCPSGRRGGATAPTSVIQVNRTAP